MQKRSDEHRNRNYSQDNQVLDFLISVVISLLIRQLLSIKALLEELRS